MVSGYGQNSRRIVKDYRDSNPGVTGLWRSLDEDFKSAVGGDFRLQLPSGRVMTYKDVRSEWKLVPRSEDDAPLGRTGEKDVPAGFKRKLCFTADVGGMRSTFYGGLLTENLVQATARDVFAFHVLLLNSTPGISVLFTVHDEAVCECASHITAKQVQNIMSVTPPWLTGCPVTAEAKEVPCYEK
jgi:DNA polymerase